MLRSDFLDLFFELLGWDIKNTSGKTTNEREVILEESLKTVASEHSKKPDYTFRLFSERKFFVEAKKPFIAIESNIETAKQVRPYGFTAKLKISVVSKFEYLIIYDTSVKVEKDDTFQNALIKKFHLYYPESPYSFSVFSSDVLGSIYEIFLSEKLAFKDDTVILVKKPENVDRDIITTPTFIINDILRNTVLPKCDGKSDAEILNLKFADIACGSRAFLQNNFSVADCYEMQSRIISA